MSMYVHTVRHVMLVVVLCSYVSGLKCSDTDPTDTSITIRYMQRCRKAITNMIYKTMSKGRISDEQTHNSMNKVNVM